MPDRKEFSQRLRTSIDSNAKHAEAARNAVAHLFPKFADALGSFVSFFSEDGEQRVNFRLQNKDFAAAYFNLDPIRASWTHTELDELISAQNPHSALDRVEQKIAAASETERFTLRRIWVEQLETAFATKRALFSQEWMDALVAFSPFYIKAPDELAEQMFAIDFLSRLEFVLLKGLAQKNELERVEIFRNTIRKAADISLLCGVFRLIAGDTNPEGGHEQRRALDFGDATEELRLNLLEKIRNLLSEGQFWVQADPYQIIWFWWGADRAAEVRKTITEELERPEAIRSLLDITVNLVRSSAGNYEQVPASADKVVDIERLSMIAHQMVETADNPGDQRLARRFLAALENRKKDRLD